MKYLNKRKFPRGIKRLHAGSQLLLHIGSTLEKGTRVTRGDYPAPVCLKDTTAKRRKALGRICRTTNVIKEFLKRHTPAATQLNSRRKKHEASRVKQALIGLSFPILASLRSRTKSAVTADRVPERHISSQLVGCSELVGLTN